MKILQIHNFKKIPGGEDVILNLEKRMLIKNGHEVKQLNRYNLDEIKNIKDITHTLINLSYSKKSLKILEKEIQNYIPDIVHIHDLFPLWTYSVIDFYKKRNIPIIMSLHNFRSILSELNFFDKNFFKYGLFKNSKILSFIISKIFNKNKKLFFQIDKFIVFTNFSKQQFLNIGIPEKKIIIKPHSLENIEVNSKDYKNKKNQAIYAGLISNEKGILTLIKAWQNIDIKLNIYGDGPLLNKLIKKNKFPNKIIFHRRKDSKYVEHQILTSKILIFPSECYETMGMSMLQAFRSKTLVIASNHGTMSSVIKNKYNGILFKTGCFKDLYSKIIWAINHNNEREIIVNNAFKEFNINYSEDQNYRKLLSAYNRTINKKINEL